MSGRFPSFADSPRYVRGGLVAVALVLAVGCVLFGSAPAAVLAVAGMLVPLALADAPGVRSTAWSPALRWFAIAAAIRLVTVLLVTGAAPLLGHTWWFFDDENLYFQTGSAYAQIWQGKLPPSALDLLTSPNGYMQLLGAAYWVGGADPLLGRVATAIVSATVAPGCWWLARQLFGRAAAEVGGALSACWPSLVLWGAMLLKDGPTAACVAVLLACAVYLLRGWGLAALAGLVLALGLTVSVRDVPGIAIGWLTPPAAIARGRLLRVHRAWQVAAITLACLGTLFVTTDGHLMGLSYLTTHTIGFIELKESNGPGIRGNMPVQAAPAPAPPAATGSSTAAAPAAAVSPGASNLNVPTDRLASRVLHGLVAVAVEPLPFQFRTLSGWALAAETLLWDAALALSVWSLASGLRRRELRIEMLAIAVYLLAMWFALAAFEDNLGTLFRHRSMLLPPLMALASPALLRVLARLRGAHAPHLAPSLAAEAPGGVATAPAQRS